MRQKLALLSLVLAALFLIPTNVIAAGDSDFNGKWVMIPEKSSQIELYGTLSLEFKLDGNTLTLIQKWGRGRSYSDTLAIKTNGKTNELEVTNRVFPTNVFMALQMPVGKKRSIKAEWSAEGQQLNLTETYQVHGSQGYHPVTATHTFMLDKNNQTVAYSIKRATRKTGPAISYLFKREGSRNAYYMDFVNDWKVKGNLGENAMLISLQGLANVDGPNMYFVYPEDWDFRFTPDVKDFLNNERYYTFNKLKSPAHALKTFKDKLNGYVVWDKEERTSLIVAFTVAGLEQAVVVSEDQIPLVEKLGLKKVEDFRGKFTGQSDLEIYQWAYDQYWDRCSREYLVWMGGHAGSEMKPGVADWGIYKKAFFTDLSTAKKDTGEYEMAKKLMSQQKTYSFVFGWHSYGKDKERDHTTMCSNYGLRMEGLHTLPNMSFSSQVPASPGFKFKNNHHVVPGKTYTPEKDKVYVACIQTDCLGLGAWTRPGRGEIPYAWEVTMNWVWLAPSMMEFFYTQATPNDYFIGSLSGPGYMYPKAIPEKFRKELFSEAYRLMKTMDLNVFEIMDYSEGATVEGNTELPKSVIKSYYQSMPDAIGFANGYAPAYTFYEEGGRPLMSFDYYLSADRAEEEAAADLQELSEINDERPYFLLMHVRQWSDITRVRDILDRLGPEFEIVPLDIFLKMAGNKPTFEEYTLPEK